MENMLLIEVSLPIFISIELNVGFDVNVFKIQCLNAHNFKSLRFELTSITDESLDNLRLYKL